MRILVTGGNGQLGNELQRILREGRSEIGRSRTPTRVRRSWRPTWTSWTSPMPTPSWPM